jgi:Holliday junction DNA helicase RuvA
MISYVRGELVAIEDDKVILDVNGVGFGIYMPTQSMTLLPTIGEEVRSHTYMNVREDAMQLFGFLTRDDLNVFKLVIGVSGIGPKGGLNILSQLSPDDLRFAVMANDAKTIAATPGIGKKTAEKLIIELKDKLSIEDVLNKTVEQDATTPTTNASNEIQAEAVQALVALGYGSTESMKAVKKVPLKEGTTVEEVLKLALKNMMF